MAGLTQPRKDPLPPPLPSDVEGDWYNEPEPPWREVWFEAPRDKKAKEDKQEFVEIKGKM